MEGSTRVAVTSAAVVVSSSNYKCAQSCTLADAQHHTTFGFAPKKILPFDTREGQRELEKTGWKERERGGIASAWAREGT